MLGHLKARNSGDNFLCFFNTLLTALEAPEAASPRPLRHATDGLPVPRETRPSPMTLPLDFLVSALVTLFVVVDPVGLTPAFIGLTAGLPRNSRRQVALRACLIAFAILAGSALIGDKGVRASRPFMRHH